MNRWMSRWEKRDKYVEKCLVLLYFSFSLSSNTPIPWIHYFPFLVYHHHCGKSGEQTSLVVHNGANWTFEFLVHSADHWTNIRYRIRKVIFLDGKLVELLGSCFSVGDSLLVDPVYRWSLSVQLWSSHIDDHCVVNVVDTVFVSRH